MGSDVSSGNEAPEHPATVSPFYLDRFEVTVGRMRRFVSAFDAWGRPAPGDGAAPGDPDSGWKNAWFGGEGGLPATGDELAASLRCGTGSELSTYDAADEYRPINCVVWPTAFAFCVWDGGRLPTEAEWEFAATGGAHNWMYPWGDSPALSPSIANTACNPCTLAGIDPVGQFPAGQSPYGQYDLIGGLWELVLDGLSLSWYAEHADGCDDCVNATVGPYGRVVRGGSWFQDDSTATVRSYFSPIDGSGNNSVGFRCARPVPP